MNHKLHAEHNEKLCDYLIASKEFNDWVVTSAFYSDLHFVNYKLFPLKINDKNFNSLDDYFISLPRYNKPSKHKITLRLVKFEFDIKVSSAYRWLFDNCIYSRYLNYSVSEEKALMARKYLDLIKNYCLA